MVLIINIDGASRGNPGPAAAAMSVTDEQGAEIVHKEVFFDKLTNNQVEYEALFLALDFIYNYAKHTHGGKYVIQSDSRNLVGQMSQGWKIIAHNRHYYEKAVEQIKIINDLLNKTTITFEWIPRDMNGHADELCNFCLDKNLAGKVLQHDNPDNPQSRTAITLEEHRMYHQGLLQPAKKIELTDIEIEYLRKFHEAGKHPEKLTIEEIQQYMSRGSAIVATILAQVKT